MKENTEKMNINDIVRIKNYDDLPEEVQTQKMKNLAGMEAEIIDRLYSETAQAYFYALRLTGAKTVPSMFFPETALELVENEPAEYFHEIEYLDNLVLVRFYEVKGDAFAPRNPKALKIDFVKRPPYFDVSPTHKARTWLLDPRAPKIDPPEAVMKLATEGVKGYE